MSAIRRLSTITAWSALMLLCLWLVLTRIPVSTDLDAFMPGDGGPAGWLSQLSGGPAQRLILIGIADGSEAERAAASRALSARLRDSGFFTRVMNGAGGLSEAERRLLFSYRYLLSPATDAQTFSVQGLREALRARLDELRSALSLADMREITADPTQAMRALLQAWQGGNSVAQRRGVWFSPDGERALLMAQTRTPGFDLDAQARVVAAIRTAFTGAAAQDMTLALSGPPIFALRSQETIRSEATLLSVAASLAVAAILWVSYRSWRALLVAALPLVSAILVAMTAAGLWFGELYGITLGFGMTLLGVAVDYPIHVFSHRNASETVGGTLTRIWPMLKLGAISTAFGYLAMMAADLVGLQQLGVFAVAGLLTAAAATRWLLPALLPPAWTPHPPGVGAWMDRLLSPRRWQTVAFVATCAVLVAAALFARPQIWENDPAALNPIPADTIALDRELREALGAPEAGYLAVITADRAEIALRQSELLAEKLSKLVDEGLIGGFDMAARYLPSRRTQRTRQAVLPPSPALEANLAEALAGLAFKRDAFEPFLKAVESAHRLPPLTPADLEDTALGARIESLLFKTQERGQERWIALAPLAEVRDPDALDRWFASHGGEARYVGLKAETAGLMADFRNAALMHLAWGVLLIIALLWWGLRDPRRVAAVIVPVGLAVTVTVAALLLAGNPLTLFHIVSLLLVLGIGIDYSLFFSRPGQDRTERRSTLHAIMLCVFSTVAVFGMLALSAIPVLRAIGLTAAIGVCASFLAALVLARPRAMAHGTIERSK